MVMGASGERDGYANAVLVGGILIALGVTVIIAAVALGRRREMAELIDDTTAEIIEPE